MQAPTTEVPTTQAAEPFPASEGPPSVDDSRQTKCVRAGRDTSSGTVDAEDRGTGGASSRAGSGSGSRAGSKSCSAPGSKTLGTSGLGKSGLDPLGIGMGRMGLTDDGSGEQDGPDGKPKKADEPENVYVPYGVWYSGPHGMESDARLVGSDSEDGEKQEEAESVLLEATMASNCGTRSAAAPSTASPAPTPVAEPIAASPAPAPPAESGSENEAPSALSEPCLESEVSSIGASAPAATTPAGDARLPEGIDAFGWPKPPGPPALKDSESDSGEPSIPVEGGGEVVAGDESNTISDDNERLPTGHRVTSRIYEHLLADSFRSNGGHVFLIQIDLPDGDETQDQAAAEAIAAITAATARGEPPPVEVEIPLSCYTVYSSWSGRYTMQQFIDARPELTQMNASAIELWLGALTALTKCKEWSAHAEDLFSFLFGCELSGGGHGHDGVTGVMNAVAGGKASAAEPAPATASTTTAPATAPTTQGQETVGEAADEPTESPTASTANVSCLNERRLPYLAALELGLDTDPVPLSPSAMALTASSEPGDAEAEAVAVGGEVAPSALTASQHQNANAEYPEYLSPADGWSVEYEEPILWELHYWAKEYDRTQLEYNACVIEQLHKMARESHEQIVGRVASDRLPKLDRLQARTLHGEPFGHRCARNMPSNEDEDGDKSGADGSDEGEGEDDASDSATQLDGEAEPTGAAVTLE